MRDTWATPSQMGHTAMSKTITPTHFGETRANPARSMIILRAWAIWRARQCGWCMQRAGRERQIENDVRSLERDVRSIAGDLLGNPAADAKMRKWVPDLAEWMLMQPKAQPNTK